MEGLMEGICEPLSDFLQHLDSEPSHSACLGGVNRNPNVMNDLENFHSTVLRLPQTDAIKVISCIQECIDHCSMKGNAASQRLKLLRDIASDLGHYPESYHISDVSKDKEIFRGGEARLYVGSHCGRTVAIRRFHTGTMGDQKILIKTIIREVISHWQLRHPNIVDLIGVHKFKGDCHPSPVLQYAKYSSAIGYLELHPEAESFATILLGLFEGVHYLHTRWPPVIHGDLHNGNVLVSDTGDCLLCDFGLSRIKHGLGQTSMTDCRGGAHQFIAPELSSGNDTCINQPSDIYSLAMTIYALGTRSQPFQGKILLGAWRAAADGDRPAKPASLGGLTVEHTKLLWKLMKRMWHRYPKIRPRITRARSCILRSDIMNLVQPPAPITTAPTNAQHLTPAPPPIVPDETIQQVPTRSDVAQWKVATSDVPRHGQFASLLPFAPSPFGMHDSVFWLAGTRQFPKPSSPSVLRDSLRLQANASGSQSLIETAYVAKNDQSSHEATAGSHRDSVSGTILATGNSGESLRRAESASGAATTTSPSLLLSSPVQSLGSSLKSAAADTRSYILSHSPLGNPGTAEPAASVNQPPPTPATPPDRREPIAAGSKSSILSRSPLGRPRGNTKSAVAHVNAPSPPSFEDSGSSIRSAIAGARSYVPRDLPVQRFGNLTASPSSPSEWGNLKSNLKAAMTNASSYVLSPSPSGRLGSIPEPSTGSPGASSSGLGRLGSLKSSVADFHSSPLSHSFFGTSKGSPRSPTAGARS